MNSKPLGNHCLLTVIDTAFINQIKPSAVFFLLFPGGCAGFDVLSSSLCFADNSDHIRVSFRFFEFIDQGFGVSPTFGLRIGYIVHSLR